MRPPFRRARRGQHRRDARRLAAPVLALLVLGACRVGGRDADRAPSGSGSASYAARDPGTAAGVATDPAFRMAAAALSDRRPWRAELVLAPALADSARRTPTAVLLAAEAAAATGRWVRVDSLLQSIERADSVVVLHARLLLARSALEQGAP